MISAYAWVLIALLAAFCLAVLACLAYASHLAVAHARQEAHERAALNAAAGLIAQTLQSVNRDLLYLSRKGRLALAINEESEATKHSLAEDWVNFSLSKGIYDKIRWIDEHGRERVRINYAAGEPAIVAEPRLQDRSLRYFFRDALNLKRGEIYVSPFDLNVEGEALEMPYKPTVRFVTPVFDVDGRPRGILVLNYLGADLFERLKSAIADVAPYLWLLNADGYWLHSPDAADEWGFMLNRRDLSMASRNPAAWEQIMARRSGQFFGTEGLWTFDTVYPLLEGQKTSSGSAQVFSPSQDSKATRLYSWKLVTVLPLAHYHDSRAPEEGLTLPQQLGQSLFRLADSWRNAGRAARERAVPQVREELVGQIFENSAEAVMITDVELKIQMVNPAFTRITGYAAEESLGRTPQFLQSGHHPPDFYEELWARVLLQSEWQGEIWNRRKSGELYAEWLTISAVRSRTGSVTHYVCQFSDITRLKEAEQRMEYFAHHDTLTGLANRRLLSARLEHSIQLAQRSNRQFALLFIDLDHFKVVNDQLGHAAGDELLKRVARQLGRPLRAEDTLARLGGDEFVILLENADSEGDVERVVDAVLAQFPYRLDGPGGALEVTASIGISYYPRNGTTPATLLGGADHAMYLAKRQGRNQAQVSETSQAAG